MKYVIFLADGAADFPVAALGNKTPLQVAKKPWMDRIAREGRCGSFITVEDDMPPGSEVANLTVLGYDPKQCHQGRGVLEAASMGVKLRDSDIALRCNLICIEDGKIKNFQSIAKEKGIAPTELHKLGEKFRAAYEQSMSSQRFVTKIGDRDVVVTQDPHLGEEIAQVIHTALN